MLPLLETEYSTQYSRVSGAGTVGLEADSRYQLIEKAYKQIFFHAFKFDREPYLESQYLSGSITARDFVRGLLLSKRFLSDYYQCNSNYGIVDQVIGRVLGREVYSDQERIKYSIVIATSGFEAFVDLILDCSEYLDNFGYDSVPSQRSRILPGQSVGQIPIYQKFPRYASDWRDSLAKRAPSPNSIFVVSGKVSDAWKNGQPPEWALKVWLAFAIVGGFEVGRVFITLAWAALKH